MSRSRPSMGRLEGSRATTAGGKQGKWEGFVERLQCETTCILLFSGRLCGLNVSMGTDLIPLLKNAELYGICKDMTKPVTLVGDDALTLKQRSYFSYDFVANCAAIVDSPKAE
ncbi:hypothetical protein A4X09_0g7173 [Tilletia walkeri]|uniref:Uncharacterized protein n=1 Tax=Tilletia walkeri TaxID=117179 RepID=A0A8X7N3M9_9BASI|nr:hypothetical protein A4X09_0g7173 [Tilletia walkeri]